MNPTRGGAGQAAALRQAFDAGFALPPPEPATGGVALLLLQAGGTALALPCAQIAGLHRAGRMAALPSRAPELAGLAGLRGRLLPVFRLTALLGLPDGEPAALGWLALARGGRLAAGFERLEGQVTVAPAHIITAPGEAAGAVVRLPQGVRPVVDLDAALAGLRRRLGIVASQT